MTFEKDGIYHDVNGDNWRVLAKNIDIKISICNGRMPTKTECEEIRRLMDTLGIACGQDNVDIEVDGRQEWELSE